ncbi:MAG: N-acetylmuramoyl-L-alanine amidase [Deltaproteobacteria bacterium]|nr:N-acetylmuramoyl-L-alanine amidase [Deltaproteobacteria bacterium]
MQRVRSLGAAIGALLLLLSAQASAQIAICVDPGHGGTDPGAQGCGLSEADINLATGLALRDLLAADPALKPLMTRTTDVFVSLGARAAYANDNGAVRFASVHSNSATPAATGIETYSATSSSAASVDQRDRIQDAMVAAWPLADRGGKTAGFYVIVNTVMPATLSELGFITNCDEDAKWLGSSAERQKAAQAHLDALRASLGLEPGEGPGPTPTTGTLRGVVYEDQGVGSADLSVRLPGAQVTASCPGTAGGSAVAASPDGAWLFERPPGTCTVTASMAGYVSASRACAVLAGATTWCSVGLAPVPVVAEPVPDAGMPDVSTPDTSTTPDPGPDLSAPPDEGEPPDAGVPDVAPADAPADPGLETVGPPADSAGGDAAPDVAGPRPRVITFGDATVLPPRAGAAEEAGGGCQGAGGAPRRSGGRCWRCCCGRSCAGDAGTWRSWRVCWPRAVRGPPTHPARARGRCRSRPVGATTGPPRSCARWRRRRSCRWSNSLGSPRLAMPRRRSGRRTARPWRSRGRDWIGWRWSPPAAARRARWSRRRPADTRPCGSPATRWRGGCRGSAAATCRWRPWTSRVGRWHRRRTRRRGAGCCSRTTRCGCATAGGCGASRPRETATVARRAPPTGGGWCSWGSARGCTSSTSRRARARRWGRDAARCSPATGRAWPSCGRPTTASAC